MASLKLICAVVLLVAVAAPMTAEAIDCNFVLGKVMGCFSYLSRRTPRPTNSCCDGVSALNSAASSTPDRQMVCECLKSAAKSLSNVDYGLAGGLPKACRVSIPYKISPSTNCKSVK